MSIIYVLRESVKVRKRILLVFRVTPFKMDRNKDENRSIDKV